MATKSFEVITKSKKFTDFLRSKIATGDFRQGEKFPSITDLATEFGLNRTTVDKVVSILVAEGLLYRLQGKGTFVSREAIKKQQNSYALFIHAKGHVYENQSRVLLQEIQEQGCFSEIVDINGFSENSDQIIQDVINTAPLGIIIDGFFRFPFRTLRQLENKITNLCFINRYENDYLFRARYVLSDSMHGSYLATKHLLGLGHKKILLVIPGFALQGRPGYEYTEHFHNLQGYTKALQEYDVETQSRIFYEGADVAENKKRLIDFLTASDRPTAVFAHGDFRAKAVIDVAKELGLKIPEDLAVVGYFNTPWATMIEVPLTSVSIKEETIARTVIQKLRAPMNQTGDLPETTYVKPELVVRTSSQGKAPRQV